MGNLVLGKGTQARWREGQDILQLDLFEFGTAAPAALRPTALHGRTALADLVAPAGGGVGTDGPAAGATGRGGPANGDRPGGSGNPIVIEKARIDAEVARLSRLHCEHQETLYKLRSRVRHLTDDIPRLEQRLDAVRRDLTIRQDTSGDKFVMMIEGQEIRDRGIAGELLLRRAEKLRGCRAERQVGGLAGFQVFVADNFMQGPEILLKGATTYTAKVTDTAHGTIRSVEYVIQHLEEVIETLTRSGEASPSRSRR